MTCGIYSLKFKGTDKVYIGQSINIEHRYKQHLHELASNKSNYKMLEAYSLYGIPEPFIIAECSVDELDELEDLAIEIWGAVDNGFNIYKTANEAPTYTGYGYGNSKYPKERVLEVFNLLIDTDKSFGQISEITGIPAHTVSGISASRSHLWLREDYPERYAILVSKATYRKFVVANTVISDKLSAKSRGISYPPIKSPEGIVYSIENAYRFAKEHGLAPNHFQEVLNGHRKSHKGWKVCQDELQLLKH